MKKNENVPTSTKILEQDTSAAGVPVFTNSAARDTMKLYFMVHCTV